MSHYQPEPLSSARVDPVKFARELERTAAAEAALNEYHARHGVNSRRPKISHTPQPRSTWRNIWDY